MISGLPQAGGRPPCPPLKVHFRFGNKAVVYRLDRDGVKIKLRTQQCGVHSQIRG